MIKSSELNLHHCLTKLSFKNTVGPGVTLREQSVPPKSLSGATSPARLLTFQFSVFFFFF